MQKKLIALAVAGVMAAPMVAQAAGAEVYGQARMSVGIVSNDATGTFTSGGEREDSKISVTSHASRLGFKGSEDLGGMTAVYQIEAAVDMDNGSDLTSGLRNTFVGVATGSGTYVLGKHDTPYKAATGKVDVFSDTHADFNAVMGGSEGALSLVSADHDARADNVIAYISPDMSGFSVFAAYVPDLLNDDLTDSQTSASGGTMIDAAEAFSIAGMYTAGPLYAALAIQTVGADASNGGAVVQVADDEATKIVVGYKLGATDLGFVYEMLDGGTIGGAKQGERDNFYFSVAHDLGNGLTLKAALGQAGENDETSNVDANNNTVRGTDGADFFALGVSKAVSKTTEFYALYTTVDNDTYGDFDLDYVGAAGPNGPSANAIAAGVNIKFSSM